MTKSASLPSGREPSAQWLPGDPGFPSQWHLRNTGQTGGTPGMDLDVTRVWDDYTGAGIRVGIVDDGFDYMHPDLVGSYDQSADRDTRGGDNDARAESGDNHGTTVAGVIGATANGSGLVGVAFGATLVGTRIGYGSNGTLQQLADALAYQVNVDVSNNSWSFGGYLGDNFLDPAFAGSRTAIENAAAHGRGGLGTVFVFAAANERISGDDVNLHSYQNSPYTIAVAALDASGNVASFSNPGAALLVSAPGAAITTTDRVGSPGYTAGDQAVMNGTSFAAPAVSGIVALMLEANPLLGYRDVQEILAYSARQVDADDASWHANAATNANGGGLHFSRDYGFGLADAHAAVRLAETWTTQHTFDDVVHATASASPGLAIPDGSAAGTSTSLVIAEDLIIDRVRLYLDIDHTWIGDLKIALVSPSGTESLIVNRPGKDPFGSGDGTSQDDIRFWMTSNEFWGERSDGTWTIKLYDLVPNDAGSLLSWSLDIFGDAPAADDTYIYTDDFGTYVSAAEADRRMLADESGHDTINAAAAGGNSVLDLRPGAPGSIAGNSLVIAAGAVIEDAIGGDGNDRLTGNGAANRLEGGRGNDRLEGGDGDDVLLGGTGADTMVGGLGNDTYHVDAGDVITESSGAGTDTVIAAQSFSIAAFNNVENLTVTGSADTTLTGNKLANLLTGNGGDNRLIGGGGNDQMHGGAGDDVYVVSASGAKVFEDPDAGADTIESSVTYTLSANVESLVLTGTGSVRGTGNELDNVITGNGGGNTIDGKAGADRMTGAGGNDTYYVDNAGDEVVELAGGGIDTVRSTLDFDASLAEIENVILTGSAGTAIGNGMANQLTGNGVANRLEGGAGDDILKGQGGADTMVGGLGADDLYGGGGYDLFLFRLGEADGDTIFDFLGNGAKTGDTLRFEGYGDAALSNVSDVWTVAYAGGSETFQIVGVTALASGDYLFA